MLSTKKAVKYSVVIVAMTIFIISIFKPIGDLSVVNSKILSLTLVMIVFWIFNIFHYALVALFPLVLSPILNIATFKETMNVINNPILPLVLGSMVLGVAFKQSGLDKRLAYLLLYKFSNNTYSLTFAFIIFTAFLSMFINNTSTTLIALFIVSSIITVFPKLKNAQSILLIVIAYSSLIGGNATIIGSPSSSLTYSYMKTLDKFSGLTFFSWSAVALPFTLILLVLFYLLIVLTIKYTKVNVNFTDSKSYFKDHLKDLGSITITEKLLIIVLTSAIVLWIVSPLFKLGIDDAYIAVVFSFLVFFIPRKNLGDKKWKPLVNFENIKDIPWFNFPLLIGGYLLSYLWQKSSLIIGIMGDYTNYISLLNPFIKAIIFLSIIMLITELTANSPVAALCLPIITTISGNTHFLILALLVTIGSNASTMLPSSTPTMSLIYGEKELNKLQVFSLGLILKLLIIFLFSIFYFCFPFNLLNKI